MKIMFAVFQNFDKRLENEIKHACALRGYEVNIDSRYYIEAIHKSIDDSYDYLIISEGLEVDKVLSEDDIIKFKCKNPKLKIVVIGYDEKFESMVYYTILKENFSVNVISDLICSNKVKKMILNDETDFNESFLKEIKEDELEDIFKVLHGNENLDLINYFNNLCNKYEEAQMLMLISMLPISINEKLSVNVKYKELENKLNKIIGNNKENMIINKDFTKFSHKSYFGKIIKKLKSYV